MTLKVKQLVLECSCGAQVAQLATAMTAMQAQIQTLIAQGKTEMADLTKLTADVQANTDVENSAITLINGLAAQLKAAGTDPQKLADLQTQLETSGAALGAAVAANTPAADDSGSTNNPPPSSGDTGSGGAPTS